MPEREVHKALNCIRQRKYTRGLSLLIKARTGFKKSVIAFAQRAVRMEMICLCRNQTSPFKGGKTVEEIGEFDWEKQFTELSEQCPILSSVLIGALTTENVCTSLWPRIKAMYVSQTCHWHTCFNPGISEKAEIYELLSGVEFCLNVACWLSTRGRKNFYQNV